MDWDTNEFEWRGRYRLCRVGFGLCALGMALLSVNELMLVGYSVTFNREIQRIIISPTWHWAAGSTITWSTLLGPYLLWGRWSEPHWRRRAGLLVFLNLADVGLWFLRHGQDFGFWPHDVGHEWLRMHLTFGSSWVQFVLFAALADDMAAHLNAKWAPATSRRIATVALVGGLAWGLLLLQTTAWHRGWPLRPRRTPLLLLMFTILPLARAVASFQLAALCAGVCRECSLMLGDLERGNPDLAALRSRSEFEDEDRDDPWAAPRDDPWR